MREVKTRSERRRNWAAAALSASLCWAGCSPTPAPGALSPTGSVLHDKPVADGNQRLSPRVEPLRYRLHFDLDPASEHFEGRTEIDVRLHEPTQFIHLHALKLDLLSVSASQEQGQVTPIVSRGPEGGLLLELPRPVQGDLQLHFEYRAGLEEVPDSLYRAREGDSWYAFTQFEALAAREAFPCFDEPQFKTPYAVSVTAPPGLTVAANAPLLSSTPQGTQVRHTFAVTQPLPSYLVALAVGDFDINTAPAPAAGVPLRIVSAKGKGQDARYALGQTGPILQYLVDYFGRPYPYDKLDMVAVPSFRSGAMENAGLVTYRERLLLLDEAQAGPADKLASRSVIAHELAHMWFGNLVTMMWWDDLWLNEAFATWMASKVLGKVAPETEPDLRAVRTMGEVMSLDALQSATPIQKTIVHAGDIRNAFDSITYRKGHSVLRMLESWVGQEPFRSGIRQYLTDHAWKNATAGDLLSALDQATGKPVSRVARTFIEQPGTPLVTVEWSCNGQSAHFSLRQRRYRMANSDAASASEASNASNADGPVDKWAIPLCMKLVKGQQTVDECLLLDEPSKSFTSQAPFCPEYVHPNRGEAGYFRWQLADDQLKALTGQFLMRLPPVERVGLSSHAQALLEAGALTGTLYVDLLAGLAQDPHWLSLEGVLTSLEMLSHLLGDEASRRDLSPWAHRLLTPHVQRIGRSPRAGEPAGHALIRTLLLDTFARLGRDAKTLQAAQAGTRRFLRAPNEVPTDEARLHVSLAARSGDARLHQALAALVSNTPSPATRTTALVGLSSFESPELLQRSLALLLDGSLRAQDYWGIVGPASRRDSSYATVWQWFVENEAQIVKRVGPRMSEELPWIVAGACSTAQLERGKAHFADSSRLGSGAQQNLEQALETASRCVAMRNRHGESVAARLRSSR